MIVTITKADGPFKVSEGEAQIQLRTTSQTIGVIHSTELPAADEKPHFIINGSGIELSLGKKPCYVVVTTTGAATFAYEDIS